MAATVTFLGFLKLQYPTAPGTYDLSFSFAVGADCPAGSYVVLHYFERQDVGTPRSRVPSSGTDDAGNFYGPQTFSSGNFVHGGAVAASLALGGLVAGQQVHFSLPTVTISAPSGGLNNPASNFIMFGLLWQGVASGVSERSAVVGAGAGLGNTSYHLVTPSRTAPVGTVDMIGVACADLAMQQPAGVAAVGSTVDVTCAEDGPFSRIQTILWNAPFPRTDNAENYNGPGVYISKATVTVAVPTAEVFGATFFDPTTYNPSGFFEYERNDYFAQIWCPVALAAAPTLGGVWNIHTEFGQYQKAYAYSGTIHYASTDSPVPPMMLDTAVTTPPAGTADSEPRMIRDWLARTWIVFTRTGGAAPGVYSVVSDDEGRTWPDPIMAFAGGKHPDISFDPRTGEVFRAAYVSGQIKGLVTDAAGATSPLFTLVDQNGAALAPDDDVFHVVPAPEGPRRWLLVMVKGGNVIDLASPDQGRTWIQIT